MANKLFFTPGPSQLFHTVDQHIRVALREQIPSISHRSKEFQSIFSELKEVLSDILSLPSDYQIFVTSSATEVWERLAQNLITESSHHFVNGSFSQRFYDITRSYKLSPTISQSELGMGFNSFDVPEQAELVSLTYNETSTGFQLNNEILKQVRSQNPGKIISLDVVSAVPAVSVDFSLVDTAYFSVQKCFGLPAGLGIWIVNRKCIDRSSQLETEGKIIGSYHSLSSLAKNGSKNQTPETPNMLGMYLLLQVAKDMQARGIKMIQNETIYKSTLLYQTFEKLEYLSAFVSEKSHQSKTVCVAQVEGGNEILIQSLNSKGLILGSGYGPYKKEHIRIANFPTHSKEQIEMLADYLEKFE